MRYFTPSLFYDTDYFTLNGGVFAIEIYSQVSYVISILLFLSLFRTHVPSIVCIVRRPLWLQTAILVFIINVVGGAILLKRYFSVIEINSEENVG